MLEAIDRAAPGGEQADAAKRVSMSTSMMCQDMRTFTLRTRKALVVVYYRIMCSLRAGEVSL